MSAGCRQGWTNESYWQETGGSKREMPGLLSPHTGVSSLLCSQLHRFLLAVQQVTPLLETGQWGPISSPCPFSLEMLGVPALGNL